RTQQPVLSDLPLDTQVVLVHVGWFEIAQRGANVRAKSRERNTRGRETEAAARRQDGHRVLPCRQESAGAARIIRPRIAQIRTRHAHRVSKWRAELLLT